MPAFVTGSTGLLGNNLVRTLHQADHEMWGACKVEARIIVGDLRR